MKVSDTNFDRYTDFSNGSPKWDVKKTEIQFLNLL